MKYIVLRSELNMKKKKINVAKMVWIGALFLLLVVILIMVMDYKINHQLKKHNKLYFYECDGKLCVTEVEDDDKLMYSYYDCEYEVCPVYMRDIGDSYSILEKDNQVILYDYRKGIVISSNYNDYQVLNNDYIVVKKSDKYGVISLGDEVIVQPIYQGLGYFKDGNLIGYSLSAIIVKNDDKYGIISFKDGSLIEEIKYSEEEIETLLKKLNGENASIETD